MRKDIFNDHIKYAFKITYFYLKPCRILLDFGCGNGEFAACSALKCKKVFAVDIDRENIQHSRKAYPHVNFKLIAPNFRLPFKDNYFDTVTLIEVLEHVGDEVKLLDEIYRVLKPGGTLLLTTPHKGVFTIFDTGNLKFYFPMLHKFFYKNILLKKDEYYKKFEKGSYGDFTDRNMFHKHYTKDFLMRLLKKRYDVKAVRRYSLFAPFLFTGWNFSKYVFKRNSVFWTKLVHFDADVFQNVFSYSIFIKAMKKI